MIYLDNNATTRPSDDVIDAMSQVARESYANPSSIAGSLLGIDQLRTHAASAMAELLNAEDIDGFYFTSGATESNNWVMGPIARLLPHSTIVISDIEHPSVSVACEALVREGFQVIKATVTSDGVVDLVNLSRILDASVAMVSVMAANNETGAIQPIREIGALIRERSARAVFHTDATQAVGKYSIDLEREWSEVDLLSFSAHKFHGPKGIGGIYVRPGLVVPPMIVGGGQEAGLRSGTTNTTALAGLKIAARNAKTCFASVGEMRETFEAALQEKWPSAVVHGLNAPRLTNTCCFSIPGIRATDIVEALVAYGIIVGTGSACSAGATEPPHTLLRMGVDYDLAAAALRVSFSRDNRSGDVDALLDALTKCVHCEPERECASAFGQFC